VMFCDLVGSTALSEKLDPEDMRQLMQEYQEICAKVIKRFDGHTVKSLGDRIGTYSAACLDMTPKTGTVRINTYHTYDMGSPFGRYKMSGFGRELGMQAMDLYTQVKSVFVDLNM
jgi:class 3 adenylate cyclase